MGFVPDRALNGEEAVKYIESKQYSLVVTDIYMPDVTGIDIIEIVKEKDPFTQVIAITGGAMIEKALEAIEKGAYAYMSKPFDHLKIFDHTVKMALEYRHLALLAAQTRKAGLTDVSLGMEGSSSQEYLEELKQILECVPEALMIVDADGKVVVANSIAEDLIELGWDAKTIEPKAFQAAVNGGSGATVNVSGIEYRMKAVELHKKNGVMNILFMLQSLHNAQISSSHKARKYLDVLKSCLSWFYKQRLREKEFRVLRAMAVQVTKLEEIYMGTYHASRMKGMTAHLPAMQDLDKVLSDGPQ
jgi:CheY-like chemotaxis protein